MLVLRPLCAVALLVVGAGGGVAAALVHQWWWGLMLGIAAAAVPTVALPAGLLRMAFMLGWFGAMVHLVLPRPEGDYVITASGAGYTLLGGSFGLFLTALGTLPGPRTSSFSRDRGGIDDPVVSPPGT